MRHVVAILSLLVLSILQPNTAGAQSVFYQGADREVVATEYAKRTGKTLPPESFIAIPNVGLPDSGDLWFVGAVTSRTCRDDEFSINMSVDVFIEPTKTAVEELEMGQANEYLQELIAGVPCMTEVFTTAQLSEIFFLRGMLAAWEGETERPLEYFRNAIVLSGARPWNPAWSPDTKVLYDRAQQEADAMGRVQFFYDLSDLPIKALHIDGIDLSGNLPAGSVRAIAGEHVVQTVDQDGVVHTLVVRILRDGYLLSRTGLQRVLSQPPATPEVQLVSETYLGRRTEPSSVMIYEGEDLKVFASYDRTQGGFHIAVGAPDEKFVRKVRARYGAAGFSLQGGALYYQTGYFSLTLLGAFRLVRGLELELGGGVAMTPYGDVSYFLPQVTGGARYLFGSEAVVKPYVAVRALVFLSLPGEWRNASRVGPTGCFGAEVLPPGSKALAIRIEGCGGASFAPTSAPIGFGLGQVGVVLRPIEHIQ